MIPQPQARHRRHALGRDTNWLQRDGSTFSLSLGLGVGLLSLGLVPKGTP